MSANEYRNLSLWHDTVAEPLEPRAGLTADEQVDVVIVGAVASLHHQEPLDPLVHDARGIDQDPVGHILDAGADRLRPRRQVVPVDHDAVQSRPLRQQNALLPPGPGHQEGVAAGSDQV